jgi:hypothetical protein
MITAARNPNDSVAIVVLARAEFPHTGFFPIGINDRLGGAIGQLPVEELLWQRALLGRERRRAEQRSTANEE